MVHLSRAVTPARCRNIVPGFWQRIEYNAGLPRIRLLSEGARASAARRPEASITPSNKPDTQFFRRIVGISCLIRGEASGSDRRRPPRVSPLCSEKKRMATSPSAPQLEPHYTPDSNSQETINVALFRNANSESRAYGPILNRSFNACVPSIPLNTGMWEVTLPAPNRHSCGSDGFPGIQCSR
jgi:hypothetical protein